LAAAQEGFLPGRPETVRCVEPLLYEPAEKEKKRGEREKKGHDLQLRAKKEPLPLPREGG